LLGADADRCRLIRDRGVTMPMRADLERGHVGRCAKATAGRNHHLQFRAAARRDTGGCGNPLLRAGAHFEIWEYTAANVPSWRALGRHQIKIVPVGYAPILTRFPKRRARTSRC
jgi:hypothetical protein